MVVLFLVSVCFFYKENSRVISKVVALTHTAASVAKTTNFPIPTFARTSVSDGGNMVGNGLLRSSYSTYS